MSQGLNKKVVLLVIWIVLLAGLVFWMNRSNGSLPGSNSAIPPAPNAPVMDTAKIASRWPEITSHAVALPRGPANAPFTLAEFGDFQCPQCGKIRPLIESILSKAHGQANLIFVHRPFPQLHHWAVPAAEASEFAAAHGKFWQMYDVLYTNQDNLEPGYYGDYATKLGLNKLQMQNSINSDQYKAKVDASAKFADSLGITETPTIVVHDNAHNTVTVYIGKTGDRGQKGLQDLAANPPWKPALTPNAAARTAQNIPHP